MQKTRPAFWNHRGVIAYLLWPLSLIYRLLFLLRQKTTKPIEIDIKIICIGNVIAGGAGKTPIALAVLDKMTKEADIRTCFLSKNYGGTLKEPTQVSIEHRFPMIGDEALLLSQYAPTIIAHNRADGLLFAQKCGFETVIMDDGYQNPHIHADINILVLDGYETRSNGFLLPAGPLRQPLQEAKEKATYIVNKPVITISTPAPDKDLTYTAFCGIGNPDRFFDTLKQAGYNVTQCHAFGDHHPYTHNDLEKLAHGDALITTEKDWMRLPPTWQKAVHVLKIRATLPNDITL